MAKENCKKNCKNCDCDNKDHDDSNIKEEVKKFAQEKLPELIEITNSIGVQYGAYCERMKRGIFRDRLKEIDKMDYSEKNMKKLKEMIHDMVRESEDTLVVNKSMIAAMQADLNFRKGESTEGVITGLFLANQGFMIINDKFGDNFTVKDPSGHPFELETLCKTLIGALGVMTDIDRHLYDMAKEVANDKDTPEDIKKTFKKLGKKFREHVDEEDDDE